MSPIGQAHGTNPSLLAPTRPGVLTRPGNDAGASPAAQSGAMIGEGRPYISASQIDLD